MLTLALYNYCSKKMNAQLSSYFMWLDEKPQQQQIAIMKIFFTEQLQHAASLETLKMAIKNRMQLNNVQKIGIISSSKMLSEIQKSQILEHPNLHRKIIVFTAHGENLCKDFSHIIFEICKQDWQVREAAGRLEQANLQAAPTIQKTEIPTKGKKKKKKKTINKKAQEITQKQSSKQKQQTDNPNDIFAKMMHSSNFISETKSQALTNSQSQSSTQINSKSPQNFNNSMNQSAVYLPPQFVNAQHYKSNIQKPGSELKLEEMKKKDNKAKSQLIHKVPQYKIKGKEQEKKKHQMLLQEQKKKQINEKQIKKQANFQIQYQKDKEQYKKQNEQYHKHSKKSQSFLKGQLQSQQNDPQIQMAIELSKKDQLQKQKQKLESSLAIESSLQQQLSYKKLQQEQIIEQKKENMIIRFKKAAQNRMIKQREKQNILSEILQSPYFQQLIHPHPKPEEPAARIELGETHNLCEFAYERERNQKKQKQTLSWSPKPQKYQMSRQFSKLEAIWIDPNNDSQHRLKNRIEELCKNFKITMKVNMSSEVTDILLANPKTCYILIYSNAVAENIYLNHCYPFENVGYFVIYCGNLETAKNIKKTFEPVGRIFVTKETEMFLMRTVEIVNKLQEQIEKGQQFQKSREQTAN